MGTFDVLFGPSIATFSGFTAGGAENIVLANGGPGATKLGQATATFALGEIYFDGDFGTAYRLGTLPFAGMIPTDVVIETGLCYALFGSMDPQAIVSTINAFGQIVQVDALGLSPAAPNSNINMTFPVSWARILGVNTIKVSASIIIGPILTGLKWREPDDATDAASTCDGTFQDFIKVTGNYSIWSSEITASASAKIGARVTITDKNGRFNAMPSFGFGYETASGTRYAVAQVVSRTATEIVLVIPPMPGITSVDVQIVGFIGFVPITFSPFIFNPNPFSLGPNGGPFDIETPINPPAPLPAPPNTPPDIALISYTILAADTSGIYTLQSGQTSDTYYNQDDGGTIQSAIPRPFIRTGYLGG